MFGAALAKRPWDGLRRARDRKSLVLGLGSCHHVGGRETGYNWSNPATWAISFGPLAIWARSAFLGIYVMSND